MIIDGHAHAARLYSTVESIKNVAKKYGFEKILLCTSVKNDINLKEPPSIPLAKTPNSIFFLNRMLRFSYNYILKDNGDGNQYVFELKKQLPDLLEMFLWINPLDKSHINNAEKWIKEYKVKGIKLHQAWNPFKIDSHDLGQIIEIAKAHKLPIFIHLYSKKEASKFIKFVQYNQETKFIIGHLLGMDLFQLENARPTNVFFDTSGSKRIRSIDIQNAINYFGDDHIIFGTDSPFASIDEQIKKIDFLNLSDSIKERIFYLNMKGILLD
jgi:predicted TIM-barrel fold metal-dependent hydrolase